VFPLRALAKQIADYFFEDLEVTWVLRPKKLNKTARSTECQKVRVAGITPKATAPLIISGTTHPHTRKTRTPEMATSTTQTKILIKYLTIAPPQPLRSISAVITAELPVIPKAQNRTLNLKAWKMVRDAGNRLWATAAGKITGTINPQTIETKRAETATKIATNAIAPKQPRKTKVPSLSDFTIFSFTKWFRIYAHFTEWASTSYTLEMYKELPTRLEVKNSAV
jgi:hypothetical protein